MKKVTAITGIVCLFLNFFLIINKDYIRATHAMVIAIFLLLILKDNEKREKNVEKAFKNSLNLENKNILIVDDIVTSGATINSISEELRKDNENINIKVFSIAIARHFIME